MAKHGSFRFESELLPLVEGWLTSRGFSIKREFAMPAGTCDLAGCILDKKRMEKRLGLGQRERLGPQLRIDVWTRIPNHAEHRSISEDEILQCYGDLVPPSQVLTEIGVLLKRGFVRRTAAGTLQRLNGWFPLQQQLVAVELKLERVSEALRQAKRYLSWAERSYVALPYSRALSVDRSDKRLDFDHAGIGLIGVDPCRATVIVEAKKMRLTPTKTEQIHAVERFFHAMVTGSSA